MANIIGIDLGTTFSVVSRIDEVGRPVIVHNKEGYNLTPSCVEFDPKSPTVIVGQTAYASWSGANGQYAATRFKREMGTGKSITVDGKDYSPTFLSSVVLKKLVNDTIEQTGQIDSAVVTIPASFSNNAREATLKAAREAGLKIEYIVNEPTAAALFYAYRNGGGLKGTFAVYDLGGGTFDISIIKVDGKDIEVLASNGVSKLGGDDFDESVLQLVRKKYKNITGEELEDEDFTKGNAEELKKSLSQKDSTKHRVLKTNIEITREEFEEAISSKIAQTEMLCESALEEAGLGMNDIQQVFFAGGSTRIPLVKRSVAKLFGQEPLTPANVDEVVAMGAALYALYKGDESKLNEAQKRSIENMQVQERTAKCYGTFALSRNDRTDKQEMVNIILIEKGQKIPCSKVHSFYTVQDGQTSVNCITSETTYHEEDPKFAQVIWEGDLVLPPGRPAGQQIDVSFSYTANQTMKVVYTDVGSKNKTEGVIDVTDAISSSDDIDLSTIEVE
jgi:molecular chaperone DnaK